jgi:hypothetical protein
MLFFEKSQPGPVCLEIEKTKANGDYKCGDVLTRLKNDFKNKCYLCESKEPESINVEHFVPHKGDNELKYSWNNLFWSCSHCNNIKSGNYDNILNCADAEDRVEEKLKYIFKPFPFEMVEIESLDKSDKTKNTKELLLKVYNGTTRLKMIESSNLRNRLLEEIRSFQGSLIDYFKVTANDDKKYLLLKIRGHLNTGSGFTAFKRWIIRDNKRLFSEFKQYL